MPGKLYEYAVLHHPKPALHAAREIPPEFEEKLEEVEIVVRPFAG